MEIRRIGTDIKLYVNLKTKIGQPLNIHSVQAFLVNTSLRSELKQQLTDAYSAYDAASSDNSIKYISRFPIEPMCECYRSTRYDICQSGYPTYHAAPYYIKPFYRGFGVCPHSFDAFKNHAWCHRDMCKEKFDIMKAEKQYHDKSKYIQYQARVEESSVPGMVYVYFPAEDQLECGKYSLIIVAKCFSPGYSTQTQLKTITFDYADVFELVDNLQDSDTSTINVGVVDVPTGYSDEDTFVSSGDVENDTLTLGYSTGGGFDIDLSEITAWYNGD